MVIKNIKGTSENTCSCSSWVNHWEKHTNKSANKCYAYSCHDTENIVGVHVIKVRDDDKNWYIIPLCQSCNKRDDEFLLDSDYVFAPALKQFTCG